MTISSQISKHFTELHFGNNWTASNLQDQLLDISWEEANQKVSDLNTIASLVFHINYYVNAVSRVLEGGLLDAHDQFSFDLDPIQDAKDWDLLKEKTFKDAKHFASLLEKFQDSKLNETFEEEKYGNYYRNLHGLIEHSHYHLGQIAVLKKIIKGKL